MASISGFTRPSERCEGGLSDVWLAASADVSACVYDRGADAVTDVTLRGGAAFVRYEFAEDTARYRQYVSGDYPKVCVVHELSFSLARADAHACAALASLTIAAAQGLVALVRTASGGAFLAGWSPEFGEECPLRTASAEVDTRALYDEDSGALLVLRSRDVSFSKPFTGTLPEDGHDDSVTVTNRYNRIADGEE